MPEPVRCARDPCIIFAKHIMMRHKQYHYIDPVVMHNAVGKDLDAFRSLSKTFLRLAPPMFERLERAFLAGDSKASLHQVHSLKGTTSLIGAAQLTQLLKDIENLLWRKEQGSFVQYIPELTRLFGLVMQEVQASIVDFQGDPG